MSNNSIKVDDKSTSKAHIYIYIVAVTIFLVVGYVGAFYLLRNVSYSDVVNIMSTLQNISTITFAIVGVWVAYLYPKIITEIISSSDDFLDSEDETRKIESLIITIIISAIVLVCVVTFYLIVLMFKNSVFYIDNMSWIKPAGIVFIITLVVMQIFCIISVILNNVSFVNKLYRLLRDTKMDRNL